MEAIEKANGLVSEAFELVYKDAKSKAPKLKSPMYGYFNKTKASVYLGISRTTFDVWLKKYQIPYTMIDGIRRYAKKDLDKFMEEHKRWVSGLITKLINLWALISLLEKQKSWV